jgi:ABC-2 type transport system ATP-binding protein
MPHQAADGRPGRPVIARLDQVHRRFGATIALDGLSLEVAAGEALGLLGPNGAGKTTLISLLTGVRRPDSGTVELFGGAATDPRSRLRLGVMPQLTAVPPVLRVDEIVKLVAAHFPDPMDTVDLLTEFGLEDVRGKQAGGLSGGQQRRLMVALALAGRPDLVVLDEPTTGLDIGARDALWTALRRYRERDGTLVITSHYLAEVEALADRVVVVDRGRVVGDGTVEQIIGSVDLRYVMFDTAVPEAGLRALPQVAAVDREDGRVTLATRDADATVRALVHSGIDFRGLAVRRASLEEAFLAMTTRGSNVA